MGDEERQKVECATSEGIAETWFKTSARHRNSRDPVSQEKVRKTSAIGNVQAPAFLIMNSMDSFSFQCLVSLDGSVLTAVS
jgi:hypothetical protein